MFPAGYTHKNTLPKRSVSSRTISDYSPFGVLLKERTVENDFFRRSFNGMETDPEVKGNGNSYDFGARMLDPRVGRWLTIDKRFKEYSCFSPYNFGLNNPIYYVDNDGNVIWDPENKKEVIVTYDAQGKPSFLLSNGKPVSNKFMRQSVGVLTSLSKSDQGKQLMVEMMNSPTKIIIQENNRLVPNGEVYERASAINPSKNRNGETEMTKDGYFEEVTITPYNDFISKKARRNNIDYDELLLGALTVEVGHLRPDQIQKESEMQNAEGYGRLPEEGPVLTDLQNKTEMNYEPLFNEAAFRQFLYRIEKNQPITESVSVIGTGAKSKGPSRAFETINVISKDQIEQLIKVSEAFSKFKI